jgi:hypothetical protein
VRTQSFKDVEVIFRGKRAWVQARVVDGSVQVASIRIEGDVDRRGQEVQHTFQSADPEGEASRVTAFDALEEDERADLMRQVKDALRG